LDRTIDAAAAGIFWRAAKNWLTVWKGAGFVPRLGDDGKLLFTSSWVAAFPDGPATVNLLREYMVALIRDGNAAVEDDHRLRHRPERLYANYLETNDAACVFWNALTRARPPLRGHARRCADPCS
jgi:hypothetical protein